jgi:hypothetical protein
MKNYNHKKHILLSLLITLLLPLYLAGQSENDRLLDKCASNLGTFNYIRSFDVNTNHRKKTSSEFSYVFSEGSTYIMLPCTENLTTGKMVISLFDRDHLLLGSTYDENTKKYSPDLQFTCSVTGVYYIRATITETKKAVGSCILGFNRYK